VFDYIVPLQSEAFWVGYQPHREGVLLVAVVVTNTYTRIFAKVRHFLTSNARSM